MEVNKEKSQIVQLKKTVKVKSNITKINGLKVVQKYKYLGVYFDNALTMKDMMDQLEEKLNHFSQYIHRLSLKKISLKMRFNLFQTYAASHLNYIAGIIPALKSTSQKEFEKIYFKTLKQTLNLSKYTCHLDIMKSLGAKHPKTMFFDAFIRVYRKAKKFGQETDALEATFKSIIDDMS